jgi:hypothetical protein
LHIQIRRFQEQPDKTGTIAGKGEIADRSQEQPQGSKIKGIYPYSALPFIIKNQQPLPLITS